MKAAILDGIKNIKIQDIEKPSVKPDEVLVRIRAVGVCGSDVHYFLHGRIGNQIVKGPHILGHEAAGEVVEAGREVKSMLEGMRVAIDPGIPCGKCEHCLSGRNNICPDVRFLGTPPVSGAYREYMTYPAEFLFPVPDSVSFAEAGVVETLVVGLYSVELADLKIGDEVAILGCGPIGMVTLKSAQAAGAGRIFVTDLVDSRLDIAKKYRNVTVINASKENPAEKIKQLTGGRGVDIVFEAAGALDTIRQSIETARIGGKVIWIGIPQEDYVSIEPHIARRKELVIKTVRRYKHNYQRGINAVASGIISLKDMITHEFKLEDISKAFSLVEKHSDGVMKAIINLSR